MNAVQQEKLKRFLSDKVMSDTVKEVLRSSFTKPKSYQDIHMLAAAHMALNLLDEGFKDLSKHAVEDRDINKKPTQVGM